MEPTQASSADARTFAEALARLESVATLYPASHARSREASEWVLLALRAIVGSGAETSALRLEMAQDRIRLQGSTLTLEDPVFAALHAELDALGILELEIDAAAAPEDLHGLAASLRTVGQRLSSTRTLQNIDLGALPASIRVRHREFGRRVGRAEAEVTERATLQAFSDAAARPLAEGGLDPTASAACREWVDLSMRRVVERVEARRPPPGTQSPAEIRRELQAVLQLASQTLEHALADFLQNAAGHDDLAQMFRSIEVASAVCDDPESARLMLDVLRESAEETLKPETPDRAAPGVDNEDARVPEREQFALGLEELCGKLEALAPEISRMTGLEREDRSEALAIVFGGLQRVESEEIAARFAERLPPLLHGARTPLEERTFASALRALCSGGNEHALDHALPQIAEYLEGEATESWLRIVVECAAACAPGRLAPLWPHLANELLLGRRQLSQVLMSRVAEQVARLPQASLHMGVIRLAGLSAFAQGRINRGAFDELRDEISPFCSALLRSPHGQLVGELLLESLRRNPPAWAGSIVFRTFATYDAGCRGLLLELLRQGTFRAPHPQVVAECGRLLARQLLALSAERGDEPWVVPAIEALGAIPVREAERALRRILDEKKRLVMPLWPSACRAAASRSLQAHERGKAA